MRLGKGGFLEEEPGERQPKTEIDPVGRPEAGTTQAHGESKQHRIEIYDKDSLSKERQEAGWPGKPSQSGTRDETVRPLPVNAPGTTLSNKEPDCFDLRDVECGHWSRRLAPWQSYSSVLALCYGPTAFHGPQ